MSTSKKSKVTLADFKIFDARAAKGVAVARALDNKTPIPYATTSTRYTVTSKRSASVRVPICKSPR
jgi:hypothetical protein